jgi:hypothetical protein
VKACPTCGNETETIIATAIRLECEKCWTGPHEMRWRLIEVVTSQGSETYMIQAESNFIAMLKVSDGRLQGIREIYATPLGGETE